MWIVSYILKLVMISWNNLSRSFKIVSVKWGFELSCDVAYGMDVPDDGIEGAAAIADGEKLVCGVGVVGLSGDVGSKGDIFLKNVEARNVS